MNNKICIGKVDGKNVYIDLLKLWKTRLLVMANSGGGKSWLLRLLAELICKIMPVIIIDPEGEFVTLREKFPFVLVGKGGETTADLRTAKLVMTKILELRASAIFDLSEMPLRERHEYVKLISEAAIGVPKNLWRLTCFIFDEVHDFCPENGKGESVAKKAVLAFPTQGRKRQFISIFATQRPNKLAMDARAEFLNRMIGMTFEPDDLKVAASILGVSGKTDVPAFNRQMRTMDEGNFFAFGRAISLETILVKVGMVQTSHGVDGSMPQAIKAPPTPDKVKALLPQLADLPKEAENAANVEAYLRAEITELRRRLRERPAVATPVTERVEVPVLSDKQIQDLRKILEPYQSLVAKQIGKTDQVYAALNNTFEAVMKTRQNGHAPKPVIRLSPVAQVAKLVERPRITAPTSSGGEFVKLPKGEKEIMKAIAQYPEGASREQLTRLTGYKRSSRDAYINRLQGKGYVNKDLTPTQAGIDALGHDYEPLPTGDDLIRYWLDRLPEGERIYFEIAVEARGEYVTKEDADMRTHYKRSSRDAYLNRLQARKLIDTRPGAYRAAPGLF